MAVLENRLISKGAQSRTREEGSGTILSLATARFAALRQSLPRSTDCEEQQVGCRCGGCVNWLSLSAKTFFIFLLLQAWQSEGHRVFPARERVLPVSQTHFLHSVYKHMLSKHFVLNWLWQFPLCARRAENVGLATLQSDF